MKQYLSLWEQYPRFTYRGCEIEENDSCLKVTYRFRTLGLSEFAPVQVFSKTEGDYRRWSEDRLMQDMVLSLGMVELISYWKIACSSIMAVETEWLNQDQIDWWKSLYFSGLGEFLYVNGTEEANPNHFMDIQRVGQHETQCVCQLKNPCTDQYRGRREEYSVETDEKDNGVLVPIDGEKGSVATLEFLRLVGRPICAYIIDPRETIIHTIEVAGLDAAHVIDTKCTLDSNMLGLSRQGYLNGHTSFSVLVAFSDIIVAKIHGLTTMALSSESNANESAVQGSTVNHQYPKSFKFEEDSHYYQTTYLKGNAYYFSTLHPLSEFQTARFFMRQKQYHDVLQGYNARSKIDSWCGYCPKCLSVCLILLLFLKPQKVRNILSRSMLDDWDARKTLNQLIGIEEEKPFECVGNRDGTNTTIVLTVKGLEDAGEALPCLPSYYKITDLYQTYRAREDQCSPYYDGNNLVPDESAGLARRCCADGLQRERI